VGILEDPALTFGQVAKAPGIVGLVTENDGVVEEAVEERVCGWRTMRLTGAQGQPEREPVAIDERMELLSLGRRGSDRNNDLALLFAVAACRCTLTAALSIIWMSPSEAAVIAFHPGVPHTSSSPTCEAVVRPVTIRQVTPRRTRTQHPEMPFSTRRSSTRGFDWQQRRDHTHSKSVRSYRLMTASIRNSPRESSS